MRERAFPAKQLLGRAADGVLMACGAAAGCLMLALAYDQLSAPVGYVHVVAEGRVTADTSGPSAKFVHPRRAVSVPGVPPVPRTAFAPPHVRLPVHLVSGTVARVSAISIVAQAAAGTVAHAAPFAPATEAPRVVALRAPLSSVAGRAAMRSALGAASMEAVPEPPIGFSVHPTLALVPEAQDAGPAPAVASTVILRIEKRRR